MDAVGLNDTLRRKQTLSHALLFNEIAQIKEPETELHLSLVYIKNPELLEVLEKDIIFDVCPVSIILKNRILF